MYKESVFLMLKVVRIMKEILFFVYIALISTVSTVVCFYDKTAAKARWRRVRESVLCLLGVIGGALCMLLTMLSIRHKTQHTGIIVLMSTASLLWTLAYIVIFLMAIF